MRPATMCSPAAAGSTSCTQAKKRWSPEQSQNAACLAETEPGPSRPELRRVAVAEVAEKIRFHMSGGEKLLLAVFTLAGGEELFVEFQVVEARHRSAVQSQRPRRNHQVRSLQTRIPLGSLFDQLRVVHKHIAHGGEVRKQLGQLVVELQIVGDDNSNWRSHRLLYVTRRERGTQAFLRGCGTEEQEPRGTDIRARGPPLQRVVELAQQLIRYWLWKPCVVGARFPKDQIQRVITHSRFLDLLHHCHGFLLFQRAVMQYRIWLLSRTAHPNCRESFNTMN